MNDRALYEALHSINSMPGFAPVKEWLLSMREQSRDRLEAATGEALYVEQGTAKCLRTILKELEQSSANLEKIINRK